MITAAAGWRFSTPHHVLGFEKGFREVNRRTRVELRQIAINTPNGLQRGFGPDNTHGLGRGRRNLIAFDQPHKPFAHVFMWNHAAGLHVRFGGGIGASFGRFIGRHIED